MAVSKQAKNTAEQQLTSFIEKFEPAHQALIRSIRQSLRKRFPTAYELVYDNYNFFVIGYSPTERPSDSLISIAAAANGVGLCFIHGAKLADPGKLLSGSGNQTRFLRLPSADVLTESGVDALLTAAADQATTKMPPTGTGTLIIKSVSAKQRPRRKSKD
jgi:hypothetical protein